MSVLIGLSGPGMLVTPAHAADDYPADCSDAVRGENCRTAAIDAYVDRWGFYSRECTSFAAYRLSRRGAFHNTMRGGRWGNASNWRANAIRLGYRVDSQPAVGAVAWFSSGHVAIVESFDSSRVWIEEYNYNGGQGWGRYGRRVISRGAAQYIHIHDAAPSPPPASSPTSTIVDEPARYGPQGYYALFTGLGWDGDMWRTYAEGFGYAAVNSWEWITPGALPGGRYRVEAFIPRSHGTAVVRYYIRHNGGQSAVDVDQNPRYDVWAHLGDYNLSAGRASVGGNDATGVRGREIAIDAIRWTRVG